MARTSPIELPEGYVEFYKDLESWQNENQIKLHNKLNFNRIDAFTLLQEHRKPLIVIDNFAINIDDEYPKLLIDLLDFFSSSRPDIRTAISTLSEQLDKLDLAQVVTRLLGNDFQYFSTLAADLNISPELLVFIFDHALRPFLRVYAEPYQETIREDTFHYWDFPSTCPVCGSRSHFSRLRTGDNRRFMFCDRCFTEWEVRYLQCIHCGNDEPGTIKYITVENDDFYQLYTCEECKGYLKTYDEKHAGKSTDLFIANIETVYLDFLAEDRGYTNHETD